MDRMEKTTYIERMEFIRKARDWFDFTYSSVKFDKTKSTAYLAVAEYLANKKGKTIYNDLAK